MKFGFPLLLLMLINCKNYTKNYHGYVYNTDKLPVNGVIVKENNTSLITTTTDKNGYFVLSKSSNSIKDLIFSKVGYENDTVQTVWSQHGEKLEYVFVTSKSDTIFLKRIKKN